MQKLKRAYPNAQDNLFVGYGHGDIIGHPDVMARDIIAFIKKLTLGEVSGTAHCNPLTR